MLFSFNFVSTNFQKSCIIRFLSPVDELIDCPSLHRSDLGVNFEGFEYRFDGFGSADKILIDCFLGIFRNPLDSKAGRDVEICLFGRSVGGESACAAFSLFLAVRFA